MVYVEFTTFYYSIQIFWTIIDYYTTLFLGVICVDNKLLLQYFCNRFYI